MHTKGLTVGKCVICGNDAREVWQGRVAGQAAALHRAPGALQVLVVTVAQ